jgi:hypothetical protein
VEEVVLSNGRKIVIQISEYKGRETLDIRTYVTTEKYTGFTQKGINIPLERGRELADKIAKVLSERGL